MFLRKLLLTCLLLSLVITSLPPVAAQAASAPPSIISYQGRLTDNGGNLLGAAGTTYYFKFSIWDSPTVGAGNRLWPTGTVATTTTTVTQGVFTVNIGDTANGYPTPLNLNFTNNSTLYLQVEVSSDNNSSETLSPRQQLTSAVFAQVAGAVVGTTTPSLFGTTTPLGSSFVTVQATSSTAIPLSIVGASGQTANLFQIQNNSFTNFFSINSSGAVTLGTALTAGNGGTGISSYTPGDITYANSATSLAHVASSTGGTILQTSFTTGAPTWVATSSLNIAFANVVGAASVAQGGTSIANPTAAGILLGSYAGGGWQQLSTSTLGLLTTNVAQGTNLYFTNALAQNAITLTTTGSSGAATYTGGTLNIPQYSGGGASLSVANTWSALQFFQSNSSSTQTSANVAYFGGTATSTFTSAGFLGIGTSTPFAKLSIAALGTETNSTLFAISSSTAAFATTTLFSISNTGNVMHGAAMVELVPNTTTNVFSIGTSTTAQPIFSISSAANVSVGGLVGIATSSPWGKLAVEMGTFHPSFVVSNQGSSTTAFIVSGVNQNGRVGVGSTTPWAQLSVDTSSLGGSPALALGSSAGTQFIVTSNGSVGIGTTSPFADFSLHANPGNPNTTLFAIGSSTVAGATATLFSISNTGSVHVGTPAFDDRQTPFDVVTDSAGHGIHLMSTDFNNTNAGSLLDMELTNGNGNSLAASLQVFNSGRSATGNLLLNGAGGNVGVGTTTPWAQFSIATPNGANGSQKVLFAVASSTVAGATTTLFNITSRGLVGINSASEDDMLSVTGNGVNNLFEAYSSANVSEFVIQNSGTVGVGTTSPFADLSIHANNLDTRTTLFAIGSSTQTGTTTLFSISNAGTFTFGSANATTTLDFRSAPATTTFLIANATSSWMIGTSTGGGVTSSAIISISGNQSSSTISFFGATTTNQNKGIGPAVASSSKNLIIVGNGKTMAGVAVVNGGLCVDFDGWCASTGAGRIDAHGTVGTAGSDVAEMYTSTTTLAAGTIVSTNGNIAIKATDGDTKHQTIGIVSTAPGIELGGFEVASGSYPVALAGRVPTLVNLDNGPIAVGDRIAISTSTPGVGMKAGPFDPSVAIALEPFTSTTATTTSILAFVNLNNGTDVVALAQEIASTTATTSAQALTTGSGPFASASSALKDALTSALGAIASIAQMGIRELGVAVHASVGIFDKIFAQTIVVGDLTAQTITAQQKLCIGTTCVTESQLQTLLGGSGGSTPPPSGTSTLDTTAPTVTLSGNNPETVAVGAIYADAGATVTDDVDTNLSYTVAVDGGAATTPDQLTIDTSAAGTHSIIYSATDAAGNVGTATRTVNVQ